MRRATRASCWVAAIVCALALLCLVRWRVQCRRSLEQACLETHRRFLEAVEKGRAEEAYSLMVSDYRRVCTVSDFQRIMGRYAWGEYKRFRCLRMWKQKGRWNCEVGYRNAAGFFVGTIYQYELESGEWRFTGLTRSCVD
jgi:hypothetical protein